MKRPIGENLATAIGRWYCHRRGSQLAAWEPDVIVPVPMHWRRRLVRRTNSPEILANCLSDHLNVPVARRLLIRRRNTLLQSDLPPTRRFQNVRGAFRSGAGYDLDGCRVLLVDDVLTTGATCSDAARTLKQAGAAMVAVAVLARAEGADYR